MPKSTSIAPEDFEAHMNYLQENNFRIVPLTELTESIRKSELLPDKTVAITFDDSYRDVYESAYPLLKKRNWPFTFFVNTDLVGKGKLFVTWNQLGEMSKNGVTIANHSTAHNHMVRLNANESLADWKKRIVNEITQAQEKIEKEIGVAPKIFAYPFGEYNTELKLILKKLGYISFTQQAGALGVTNDQQILPRFPFGGSYTKLEDFKLKVNSFALPVISVNFLSSDGNRLATNISKAGERPKLDMTLANISNAPVISIVSKVNCYLNGEAIPIDRQGAMIKIAFKKSIEQGRTKITCTAPSSEKGRYYWFSQLWLATDEKGNWTYTN